jgi:hypothetical protein
MANTSGTLVQGFSPYGASGRSYKTNGGYFIPQVSVSPGTNSFTYETWVYFDGPLTYKATNGPYIASILGSAQTTGTSLELFISGPGTTPATAGTGSAGGSGAGGVGGSYAFALNTWYHVAAVRDKTVMSLYINGTRIGTQTLTGSYPATVPQIGAQSFSGWAGTFNGYFSDTRMTMGVARYTGASFPVPTAPLPTR